jgi:hypothetical protein
MVAPVNSGHGLQWHQPSFASADDHHGLVEDFAGHTDAVTNTSSIGEIMNKVFSGQ